MQAPSFYFHLPDMFVGEQITPIDVSKGLDSLLGPFTYQMITPANRRLAAAVGSNFTIDSNTGVVSGWFSAVIPDSTDKTGNPIWIKITDSYNNETYGVIFVHTIYSFFTALVPTLLQQKRRYRNLEDGDRAGSRGAIQMEGEFFNIPYANQTPVIRRMLVGEDFDDYFKVNWARDFRSTLSTPAGGTTSSDTIETRALYYWGENLPEGITCNPENGQLKGYFSKPTPPGEFSIHCIDNLGVERSFTFLHEGAEGQLGFDNPQNFALAYLDSFAAQDGQSAASQIRGDMNRDFNEGGYGGTAFLYNGQHYYHFQKVGDTVENQVLKANHLPHGLELSTTGKLTGTVDTEITSTESNTFRLIMSDGGSEAWYNVWSVGRDATDAERSSDEQYWVEKRTETDTGPYYTGYENRYSKLVGTIERIPWYPNRGKDGTEEDVNESASRNTWASAWMFLESEDDSKKVDAHLDQSINVDIPYVKILPPLLFNFPSIADYNDEKNHGYINTTFDVVYGIRRYPEGTKDVLFLSSKNENSPNQDQPRIWEQVGKFNNGDSNAQKNKDWTITNDSYRKILRPLNRNNGYDLKYDSNRLGVCRGEDGNLYEFIGINEGTIINRKYSYMVLDETGGHIEDGVATQPEYADTKVSVHGGLPYPRWPFYRFSSPDLAEKAPGLSLSIDGEISGTITYPYRGDSANEGKIYPAQQVKIVAEDQRGVQAFIYIIIAPVIPKLTYSEVDSGYLQLPETECNLHEVAAGPVTLNGVGVGNFIDTYVPSNLFTNGHYVYEEKILESRIRGGVKGYELIGVEDDGVYGSSTASGLPYDPNTQPGDLYTVYLQNKTPLKIKTVTDGFTIGYVDNNWTPNEEPEQTLWLKIRDQSPVQQTYMLEIKVNRIWPRFYWHEPDRETDAVSQNGGFGIARGKAGDFRYANICRGTPGGKPGYLCYLGTDTSLANQAQGVHAEAYGYKIGTMTKIEEIGIRYSDVNGQQLESRDPLYPYSISQSEIATQEPWRGYSEGLYISGTIPNDYRTKAYQVKLNLRDGLGVILQQPFVIGGVVRRPYIQWFEWPSRVTFIATVSKTDGLIPVCQVVDITGNPWKDIEDNTSARFYIGSDSGVQGYSFEDIVMKEMGAYGSVSPIGREHYYKGASNLKFIDSLGDNTLYLASGNEGLTKIGADIDISMSPINIAPYIQVKLEERVESTFGIIYEETHAEATDKWYCPPIKPKIRENIYGHYYDDLAHQSTGKYPQIWKDTTFFIPPTYLGERIPDMDNLFVDPINKEGSIVNSDEAGTGGRIDEDWKNPELAYYDFKLPRGLRISSVRPYLTGVVSKRIEDGKYYVAWFYETQTFVDDLGRTHIIHLGNDEEEGTRKEYPLSFGYYYSPPNTSKGYVLLPVPNYEVDEKFKMQVSLEIEGGMPPFVWHDTTVQRNLGSLYEAVGDGSGTPGLYYDLDVDRTIKPILLNPQFFQTGAGWIHLDTEDQGRKCYISGTMPYIDHDVIVLLVVKDALEICREIWLHFRRNYQKLTNLQKPLKLTQNDHFRNYDVIRTKGQYALIDYLSGVGSGSFTFSAKGFPNGIQLNGDGTISFPGLATGWSAGSGEVTVTDTVSGEQGTVTVMWEEQKPEFTYDQNRLAAPGQFPSAQIVEENGEKVVKPKTYSVDLKKGGAGYASSGPAFEIVDDGGYDLTLSNGVLTLTYPEEGREAGQVSYKVVANGKVMGPYTLQVGEVTDFWGYFIKDWYNKSDSKIKADYVWAIPYNQWQASTDKRFELPATLFSDAEDGGIKWKGNNIQVNVEIEDTDLLTIDTGIITPSSSGASPVITLKDNDAMGLSDVTFSIVVNQTDLSDFSSAEGDGKKTIKIGVIPQLFFSRDSTTPIDLQFSDGTISQKAPEYRASPDVYLMPLKTVTRLLSGETPVDPTNTVSTNGVHVYTSEGKYAYGYSIKKIVGEGWDASYIHLPGSNTPFIQGATAGGVSSNRDWTTEDIAWQAPPVCEAGYMILDIFEITQGGDPVPGGLRGVGKVLLPAHNALEDTVEWTGQGSIPGTNKLTGGKELTLEGAGTLMGKTSLGRFEFDTSDYNGAVTVAVKTKSTDDNTKEQDFVITAKSGTNILGKSIKVTFYRPPKDEETLPEGETEVAVGPVEIPLDVASPIQPNKEIWKPASSFDAMTELTYFFDEKNGRHWFCVSEDLVSTDSSKANEPHTYEVDGGGEPPGAQAMWIGGPGPTTIRYAGPSTGTFDDLNVAPGDSQGDKGICSGGQLGVKLKDSKASEYGIAILGVDTANSEGFEGWFNFQYAVKVLPGSHPENEASDPNSSGSGAPEMETDPGGS